LRSVRCLSWKGWRRGSLDMARLRKTLGTVTWNVH